MTPNDLLNLPADEAAHLPPLLRALWLDAHNDWAGAHAVAQDIESPDAARVHAYLHRKEGDTTNARYWYRQAAVPIFTGSLADERQTLATHLLSI